MQQLVVSKSKVRSLYKMLKTSKNTPPQKNLMAHNAYTYGKNYAVEVVLLHFLNAKLWLISLQNWVCISLPCFKNAVNASKQTDSLSEIKILP